MRIAAYLHLGTTIHLRDTRLCHGGYVHGCVGVCSEYELEVSGQHIGVVAVYLWLVYTVNREDVSAVEG